MQVILADRIYKDKAISLHELNNTIFAVRYFMKPIPEKEGSFWCAGVAIASPTGTDPYIRQQLFAIRMQYAKERDDYQPEPDGTQGFPAVNLFSSSRIVMEGKVYRRATGPLEINEAMELYNTGMAFSQAYNELVQLAYRMRSIVDTSALVKRLIEEQAGKPRVEEVLKFYDAFKSIRLLALINAEYLGAAGNTAKYTARYRKVLENGFAARYQMPEETWDDNIKTMVKYQTLIGNDRFTMDPMFTDLLQEMRRYGINIEISIK